MMVMMVLVLTYHGSKYEQLHFLLFGFFSKLIDDEQNGGSITCSVCDGGGGDK